MRQRAHRKQRWHHSGKKKQPTAKNRLLVELGTGLILSRAFDTGGRHDVRLCGKHLPRRLVQTNSLTDSGYQVRDKEHANTLDPDKTRRGRSLERRQECFNRLVAWMGVQVEHVFAALERFRVLTDFYCNWRRRFGLRFNLIVGPYNHVLALRLERLMHEIRSTQAPLCMAATQRDELSVETCERVRT